MAAEGKRSRRSPGTGSVISYHDARGHETYAAKYRVGDRQIWKRGFATKTAANRFLRDQLTKVDKGEWVQPAKTPFGEYADQWLAGMRIGPSTRASYAKNLRLHVKPKIGDVPLAKITPAILDALYRELETSGRADGRDGGLSARTTRYVHTIIGRSLRDAVRQGLLIASPAERATPPRLRKPRLPK
jgi:hypothetical protein